MIARQTRNVLGWTTARERPAQLGAESELTMTVEIPRPVLKGTKALVVGIANEQSIAYGCARAFRELGAELAITYLNEKTRPYVEPLARELAAPIFLPLDVGDAGRAGSGVRAHRQDWGRLDILVHSIAFAPKEDLQGGLLDCSADGIRQGHGRFLPLLRAHGPARRAADEATAGRCSR